MDLIWGRMHLKLVNLNWSWKRQLVSKLLLITTQKKVQLDLQAIETLVLIIILVQKWEPVINQVLIGLNGEVDQVVGFINIK